MLSQRVVDTFVFRWDLQWVVIKNHLFHRKEDETDEGPCQIRGQILGRGGEGHSIQKATQSQPQVCWGWFRGRTRARDEKVSKSIVLNVIITLILLPAKWVKVQVVKWIFTCILLELFVNYKQVKLSRLFLKSGLDINQCTIDDKKSPSTLQSEVW